MRKERIYGNWPTFVSNGGPYGDCYQAECPECGQWMKVSLHDHRRPECRCGFAWRLRLDVVGEKEHLK